MKLEEKVLQQLHEDLQKCQTMDDLLGKDVAITKLTQNAVEQMLQCELTEHLGYDGEDFIPGARVAPQLWLKKPAMDNRKINPD